MLSVHSKLSALVPKPCLCLHWWDCEPLDGGGVCLLGPSAWAQSGLRFKDSRARPVLEPPVGIAKPSSPTAAKTVHRQARSGHLEPEAEATRREVGGNFSEPLGNRIGPTQGRAGPPPAPDPFPNAIAKVRGWRWPDTLGTETPPAPTALPGLCQGHHPGACSTEPAWWPSKSGRDRADPRPFRSPPTVLISTPTISLSDAPSSPFPPRTVLRQVPLSKRSG